MRYGIVFIYIYIIRECSAFSITFINFRIINMTCKYRAHANITRKFMEWGESETEIIIKAYSEKLNNPSLS